MASLVLSAQVHTHRRLAKDSPSASHCTCGFPVLLVQCPGLLEEDKQKWGSSQIEDGSRIPKGRHKEESWLWGQTKPDVTSAWPQCSREPREVM